jgi:hypothetical protein
LVEEEEGGVFGREELDGFLGGWHQRGENMMFHGQVDDLQGVKLENIGM